MNKPEQIKLDNLKKKVREVIRNQTNIIGDINSWEFKIIDYLKIKYFAIYFFLSGMLVASNLENKFATIKIIFYVLALALYALSLKFKFKKGPINKLELNKWKWKQSKKVYLFQTLSLIFAGLGYSTFVEHSSEELAIVSFQIGVVLCIIGFILIYSVKHYPHLFLSNFYNSLVNFIVVLSGCFFLGAFILRRDVTILNLIDLNKVLVLISINLLLSLLLSNIDSINRSNKDKLNILQSIVLKLMNPDIILSLFTTENEKIANMYKVLNIRKRVEKENYEVQMEVIKYYANIKPKKPIIYRIITYIFLTLLGTLIGLLFTDNIYNPFIKQ